MERLCSLNYELNYELKNEIFYFWFLCISLVYKGEGVFFFFFLFFIFFSFSLSLFFFSFPPTRRFIFRFPLLYLFSSPLFVETPPLLLLFVAITIYLFLFDRNTQFTMATTHYIPSQPLHTYTP